MSTLAANQTFFLFFLFLISLPTLCLTGHVNITEGSNFRFYASACHKSYKCKIRSSRDDRMQGGVGKMKQHEAC